MMRKLETFHHTFSSSGSYTFDLGRKPYSVLVKNMTSGDIKFSFGDAIDTENDSYVQMKKDTAEVISYITWVSTDDKTLATVQAEESGVVEIRILEY